MINNQSLKFLLPLVSTQLPKFYLREDFVGAYIGDVNKPEYDGKLLLVYKYPWTREFSRFDIKIGEHLNFLTGYDYVKEQLVVFVFDLTEFRDDLELILDGKYSKISAENKLKISKFWFNYSGSLLAQQILNKDGYMMFTYWVRSGRERADYCREDECWFIPNLNEEILDTSRI